MALYDKYKQQIDGIANKNKVDVLAATDMFKSNMTSGGKYAGGGVVNSDFVRQAQNDIRTLQDSAKVNQLQSSAQKASGFNYKPQNVDYGAIQRRVSGQVDPLRQQSIKRLAEQHRENQLDAGEMAANRRLAQSGLAVSQSNAIRNNHENALQNTNAQFDAQIAQLADARFQQDLAREDQRRREAYGMYRDEIGDQRYADQQREQQKAQNIQNAQWFMQQYGVPIQPKNDYQYLVDQVKGLKPLNVQQMENQNKQWQQQFNYGKEQDAIQNGQWWANFNSDNSYRNSQLGNTNFDNMVKLWDMTGQAPEGIPGVEAGTPLYDKAGARDGNGSNKITYNDIRQEFSEVAKLQKQGGTDMMSFIRNEIVPNAQQIISDGLDINKVVDEAFYAFSNGQFPTKKAYYDFIKKQMDPNEFKQWEKTQGLNFSAQPKGVGIKTGSNQKTAQWAKPIQTAAGKHGVPSQILYNMMVAESNGNPNARSHAGAIGLMQFMPGTAKGMGIDPTNPLQSIDGAARYLKGLHNQFGDWKLAVAAYNAGPGNVKKYKGIPPFKETQNYVRKVFT